MFKKLAVLAAATSMTIAPLAASASASSLSLSHAPAARASTVASTEESSLVPGSPLFLILGLVAVVGLLEVTGAVNIFGGDDSPDSP